MDEDTFAKVGERVLVVVQADERCGRKGEVVVRNPREGRSSEETPILMDGEDRPVWFFPSEIVVVDE